MKMTETKDKKTLSDNKRGSKNVFHFIREQKNWKMSARPNKCDKKTFSSGIIMTSCNNIAKS